MKFSGPNIVSVKIVADREISQLNLAWRKKSYPNDVLSWAYYDRRTPKSELWLGEIVINRKQAGRQAKDLNHSLRRELAWLYIHGFLHILGFDHKNKEQRRKMAKCEEKILKQE